ncbi:MAG: hypothetical protein ISR96_02615 [Nitrospira sp.]|nr:hypothetical protein [Nitrospira sp.]
MLMLSLIFISLGQYFIAWNIVFAVGTFAVLAGTLNICLGSAVYNKLNRFFRA